ncbi:Serine/threonine-protein kinase PrkC [Rubripirellula lacrimiformis]|uniref:Serine/threonine-protein kinase PrkC n=1 Tax=Rubripirellula lacrimiformis TaxID=1930273 RepID=A0A517N6H5_9BACT|nr:serine/threonine-protein kinase [Rubripirellula lacrimiformis]QDT02721.1 Serine/threonine-protein kinase PrkC [Rubripirellula lacrimiformis]
MPADDSIRTDASTVHRSNRSAATADSEPAASSESNASDLGPNPAIEAIAEANTVIRGTPREASGIGEPIDRTPTSVAKVLLGQRLNHFLLEAMIGGGGMGAVFKAHDEQLDRTVAIKVIPFVGEDPDLQRRFRNESQSAAKLDHPRIAKVFDAGSHGRWHYIVFEYVEGTNIRDWVQTNGPLSIDEAVLYTVQLADALQHASERGIVHRDIKPSNVLIASDGKIKLVDMGLARSDNLDVSEDMTASGVTLGTFDYISPEQAHDPRDADLRSDIYSLGCTLHFMLTGAPPYPGGTMLQKLLSHGNAPPPDTRALRPEVSGNLVAVIQKMLAKKPIDRYQNAHDLIADLHVVAARDGLTRSRQAGSVVDIVPNAMVGWLERNLPWIAAAALLVATAGWLHLESAATRDDVVIPSSATLPQRISAPPIGGTGGDGAGRDGAGSDPATGRSVGTTTTGTGTNGASAPASDVGPTPANPPETPSGATPSPATNPPKDRAGSPTTSDAARQMIEGLARTGPNGLTDFPIPSEFLVPTMTPPTVRIESLPDRLIDGSVVRDQASSPNGKSLDGDGASSDRMAARPDEDAVVVDPSMNLSTPTLVRVVGPDLDPAIDRDSSGAALAPSLARAIELANQFQITHVEIAVPVLYTPPVRIDIDDLWITSSVGGGSVVVFQSPKRVTMQSAKMISVGSHPIEFNDLHFVWNVPSDEIDGGAVFEVNDNQSIELTDCSITVNNPAFRDEVYAFDIVTDPEKLSSRRSRSSAGDSSTGTSNNASATEDAADDFPLVDMKLYNVVIRGQMTMVHMDYAAKLWLDWDNGLLAVTDRMIDTAGARVSPPFGAGGIKLSLMRLTAHTPKGVMRTRLGVSGAFPFGVTRQARKSLFIVDPASPHFEVTGLPDADLDMDWLRLDGSGNAYVVDPSLSDPMLRVSTSDGQVQTTRMSELSTAPPSWADEHRPRWSVQWMTTRLTDKSMSQRRPADYRQDDTASPPGFDEKSLPTLPLIESVSFFRPDHPISTLFAESDRDRDTFSVSADLTFHRP